MANCTISCMTGHCCTVVDPASSGSITICFPDQQILPDGSCQTNPFYDVVNRRSYWSYTIATSSGVEKFEHWALQICSALAARRDKRDFSVGYSDDGGVTFKDVSGFLVTPFDSLTDLANAIRINESQAPNTCYIYRIAILNPNYFNLAADPGTVVARVESNNLLFGTDCSGGPLLTPSVNCNFIPVPPPPPPILSKPGICEKILASKVMADQIFTCVNTESIDISSITHYNNLEDISFSVQDVKCQPVVDNENDQVRLGMTFTLDANLMTLSNDFSDEIDFTISGIEVVCSGVFCGISADDLRFVDPAMLDCQLIRIVDITHTHDTITGATLTTTITILSKFALLLKEILVVSTCAQKNAFTTMISAVSCSRNAKNQSVIARIYQNIRRMCMSIGDRVRQWL